MAKKEVRVEVREQPQNGDAAPESPKGNVPLGGTGETFDTWAIVELMGHRKLAGRVTEQVIAGAALLRIDVPDLPDCKGFTQFYGSHTIYSLTPTTEEIAKQFANYHRERPVSAYELRALPAPAPITVDFEPHRGDDGEEEDEV